ncbi:cell division protein FtsA [Candidatus Nomurabacteria bacterium]|uniref:Cell division protein FtsA n=1 Tax=candidate division WWE3 bacterium TaxID=2053526 RepID=A0A955E1S3_UNCKA|nr:cell division protein FtsA [candidate division WWE3 bacterium]MCB9824094.1 cell division protein FtsA [Candidatus Nomurabacteria bacterium]MCB9826935.1 cell division protein FtsA [Candidatus Nomurabacteria bacterium]MCB9828035.1 cell division protein FtsA [Candidatus Nomurabacteria bacterium]HXK52946.1 cell division protein FtsA [bacterium]
MPKERIITGIDIGSSKVSTIIASLNNGRLSVIGVSGSVPSKGITKGNVSDIDDTVESISKSIERAERMAGVSISSAFITLNGSHIKTQNSHGVVAISNPNSEINEYDIARVTDAARAVTLPSSEEIIHVIPRDFKVDSQEGVKNPERMSGVRLEVETHIIYGLASAIKNLTKCVQQVSIDVTALVFTALAASEATLTDTERELGTLLIDIGGGTTSVIAFNDGSPIFSSVLPIGAKHITHDLAIGLRTRLEEAEKIKLKLSGPDNSQMSISSSEESDYLDVSEFGLDEHSIPKKFLYEVIDARLNEIFKLIALEIEKAGLTARLPAGAVLTGGGALTANIEKTAKKALRMPVRIGVPRGLTGLIEEIQGPAFSASVGSVLYGLSMLNNKDGFSPEPSRGGFAAPAKGFIEKLKSFLP